MDDDEMNAIIETMKNAGVPPAQIRSALDLPEPAEELADALTATTGAVERNKIQAELAGAISRVLAGR